ncbi:hypothetical protein [Gilliamella sp. B2838]|uniref:hypothetical protein n=1 Tax=Gilliamella sp. B2838 TaxID=2818020 RepID=UPI002269CBBC|nr:hypothetical protein [Gilliamella sp. B2838]MCX8727834.1 hypothetical protein [Gilliamella sp. B2838]
MKWDAMIHLDAENLAEADIKDIYEKRVVPCLKQYVTHPITFKELFNHDSSEYKVEANN